MLTSLATVAGPSRSVASVTPASQRASVVAQPARSKTRKSDQAWPCGVRSYTGETLMQIRLALVLTAFLSAGSLQGCISTEEPGPMRFPEDPVRRDRPAPELVPGSEDVTPTERWKAKLAQIAPL